MKASIFLISSSKLLTKSLSFETLSGTFPIMETSLKKSVSVLGTKVGLKSKLSSDWSKTIVDLRVLKRTQIFFVWIYGSKAERKFEKNKKIKTGWRWLRSYTIQWEIEEFGRRKKKKRIWYGEIHFSVFYFISSSLLFKSLDNFDSFYSFSLKFCLTIKLFYYLCIPRPLI